jgi:hypothetical protein
VVEPVGGGLPGRAVGAVHNLGSTELQASKNAKIDALTAAIHSLNSPLLRPVLHHFAPGVYARQWFSEKGEITVGKIHRKETINILAAGKVMVMNAADDKDRVIITAPYVWVAPPGSRRAVVTLERTSWITIHVTDKTDLAEIEDEFIMRDSE